MFINALMHRIMTTCNEPEISAMKHRIDMQYQEDNFLSKITTGYDHSEAPQLI